MNKSNSEIINILINKAQELGLQVYEIKSSDLIIENRTRLKCIYGCSGYGKRLSCPPHIMEIDEFKKIIAEYTQALLLVDKLDLSQESDIIKAWSKMRKISFHKMLELEYLAFRNRFTYAQLMRPGACNECEICGDTCKKYEMRRFPPEAVGINVSEIMKSVGESFEFCNNSNIKCVGILLID